MIRTAQGPNSVIFMPNCRILAPPTQKNAGSATRMDFDLNPICVQVVGSLSRQIDYGSHLYVSHVILLPSMGFAHRGGMANITRKL